MKTLQSNTMIAEFMGGKQHDKREKQDPLYAFDYIIMYTPELDAYSRSDFITMEPYYSCRVSAMKYHSS